MRELVIERIMEQRRKGLDELGLTWLNFSRIKAAKPALFEKSDYEYDQDIPISLLEGILQILTDSELLFVLDAQACLRYR